MKREDFSYELPPELIARYPAKERHGSRLLVLDRESCAVTHQQFTDVPGLLRPGDLLVLNNTQVIPARLFAKKESGGKLEILVERILDEKHCLAHVKSSKSPKSGTRIIVDEQNSFQMTGREGALFCLEYEQGRPVLDLLQEQGHMPLPPYIDRNDDNFDRERYQTIYGEVPGAVAAPTAGLHFDKSIFTKLDEMGVETGFVTLHVGAGTFQPVRVDNIKEHHMHSEWYEVSEELCKQVANTRAKGGRVIAVGTTSVRCLESAFHDGKLRPTKEETDIFIYPGYQFNVVDGLLTNFHLPESTLLMLVSAFAGQNEADLDAGRRKVLAAYLAAVEDKYRFFSYGDAMFIA